jgi:hypothetical protein
MKKTLMLILFFFTIILITGQKNIKYDIVLKKYTNFVSKSGYWSFVNRIEGDSIVKFFCLSHAYDESVVFQNSSCKSSELSISAFGVMIFTRESLEKFAENLIYLGGLKGAKSESLTFVKSGVIKLEIQSIYPKFVQILPATYNTNGCSGQLILTKKQAVKLGKQIIKNISFF